MSSSKKVVTTAEDWNSRLAQVQVSKDDLNALVANYLFTEGFRDAAENFSREAGVVPPIDLSSIESRMEIRRAVQRGDVESATEMVNDLDPEILDRNPTLHFHLLQLHLIELIRSSRIPDALLFAQTELAPRGEEHPQFLSELERTMALLAFGAGTEMPESIRTLLDQEQRLRTAMELNAAILMSMSQSREPKLPGLMKMLGWGEGLLSEKGAEFPKWQFHDLLKENAEDASASAMLL